MKAAGRRRLPGYPAPLPLSWILSLHRSYRCRRGAGASIAEDRCPYLRKIRIL